MLKVQLITEQRVVVIKRYYKSSSYLEVKKTFHRRFLEKDPPTEITIWKNVKKRKRRDKSKHQ